jgi:hypothetical protein
MRKEVVPQPGPHLLNGAFPGRYRPVLAPLTVSSEPPFRSASSTRGRLTGPFITIRCYGSLGVRNLRSFIST